MVCQGQNESRRGETYASRQDDWREVGRIEKLLAQIFAQIAHTGHSDDLRRSHRMKLMIGECGHEELRPPHKRAATRQMRMCYNLRPSKYNYSMTSYGDVLTVQTCRTELIRVNEGRSAASRVYAGSFTSGIPHFALEVSMLIWPYRRTGPHVYRFHQSRTNEMETFMTYLNRLSLPVIFCCN